MATIIVGPGQTYATIQAAISAAQPGDTVLVLPGTYYGRVKIAKSITLRSTNGALATIIDGNNTTDSYYMVDIQANDVTVDGFTIKNPLYTGPADASGFLTSNAGRKSNITIINNIIHDIGDINRTSASFGTFGINAGPVNGLVIAGNTIYNIGNADGSNPDGDGWAIGIFVWGNDSTDTAANISIHGNTLYGITSLTGVSDGINCGGDSENVTIKDNKITGSMKRGIVTSPGMAGAVDILGNTVENASDVGILLRSPKLQTVTENGLSGNVTGIKVTVTWGSPEVHHNNIIGNSFGLNNESAISIDAKCNWWGSVNGPNTTGADTATGFVDFTPWLMGEYPEGICGGGIPVTTGPIVADKDAKSLVVEVLNNSTDFRTVVVNVYDIGAGPKSLIYTETLSVERQCANDIIFAAPPTEYEVEFIGLLQGVYAWTSTRKNMPKAPLSQSSFIEVNTFHLP